MSNADMLLAENNADDEVLTLQALNKLDFAKDIHVVRDGAEVLDYLFCSGIYAQRGFENPKLILLHLNLPLLDGIEVLRRIRSDLRTSLVPVVIFTSSDGAVDITKAYAAGANSYIVKPVDIDEFNQAVQRIAIYWMVLNWQPVHTIASVTDMPAEKPLSSAVVGDQIVILPTPPSDVQEIQTVNDVGPIVIGTEEGLVFAKASGVSLNDGSHYAVIATDEHRAALKEKAKKATP
jgi:two-component system, response regulator